MDARETPTNPFPTLDFSDESQWTLVTLKEACSQRHLSLPRGRARLKRKYIEILEEFQRGSPPEAVPPSEQQLYIDPATFSDMDVRFNSCEKLEAELRARHIPLPDKPALDDSGNEDDDFNHAYYDLLWADLSAWVHGGANQKQSPPEPPSSILMAGTPVKCNRTSCHRHVRRQRPDCLV